MGPTTAIQHPERFDPQTESGTLIDSEHSARYHWASNAVAGKEVLDAGCGVGYGIEILAAAGAAAVTGVDLDRDAVAEATARVGKRAKAIVEADLRELPLEDGSFDIVVCFEVIEHLEGSAQALEEMHRVLRPGGILIVSSPNPDVYLGGNEYHVHEFRPDELLEAVGRHFGRVAEYRQDAWMGSSIVPAAASSAPPQALRTAAADPGGPTYSIVVASDAEPPELPGILTMGSIFDLRWWSEEVTRSKAEVDAALKREAQTKKRLDETAVALLDANKEIAQIPLLRHRLGEINQLHADLSAQYHELVGSLSWRLTAPLRRIRRR